MEDSKFEGPMFKKKDNRVKIGFAILLVLLIVAAVVVVVVFVVNNNNNKDDANSGQIIDVAIDWPTFLSIQSTGILVDHLDVIVRYQGYDLCYTDWAQSSDLSNRLLYEAGTDRKIEEGVFETSVRLYDINIFYLRLRVMCGLLISAIQFNISALPQAGLLNDIPDVSNYTFTLSMMEMDSATDEVTIRLRLDTPVNISDGTVRLTVYMDGLNTTVSPPSAFEVWYFIEMGNNSQGLRINELPLDNGIPEAEIVVSRELTRHGGLLFPFMGKRIDKAYVSQMELSRGIEISSTGSNEVVPRGQFGIYRIDTEGDRLDIFPSRYSFSCSVMGNPVPSVQAFFTYPNTTVVQAQLMTAAKDAYMDWGFVTVDKLQFPDGGKFTCRATLNSETQTFEQTFRFNEPEFCSINSTRTGVIEQTSTHDKVRCTVSGFPLPDISLNLYRRYGPDLLKIDLFQSSRSTEDDRTISVNLTITPPNPDIHTLACFCHQRSFSVPEAEVLQNIVLYPGRLNNWRLYHELSRRLSPEQYP